MPSRGQRRDPRPTECPLEVAAIIHACLRRDPTQRPTAAEVLTMLEEAPAERPQELDETYVSALVICCTDSGETRNVPAHAVPVHAEHRLSEFAQPLNACCMDGHSPLWH